MASVPNATARDTSSSAPGQRDRAYEEWEAAEARDKPELSMKLAS